MAMAKTPPDDPRALLVEELDDATLAARAVLRMDKRHDHLDDLIDLRAAVKAGLESGEPTPAHEFLGQLRDRYSRS